LVDVDVFGAWLLAKDRNSAQIARQDVRHEALLQVAQLVDDVLGEILHRNELDAIHIKPWLAERAVGYLWTRLQVALRELAERDGGGAPLPKLTPNRQLNGIVDN
jgi:hypothetical protein